ncbi:MAG: acyl carrier protein [Magnetococcales bacterium]|nr:acyl carrier protein [Magnetococcales bacterium]
MTEDDLYARLTDIFREVFEDDALVVTPELSADDVPTWNSLSNIRMVLAVEESFQVRFSSAELSGNRNVGEFVAQLMTKL